MSHSGMSYFSRYAVYQQPQEGTKEEGGGIRLFVDNGKSEAIRIWDKLEMRDAQLVSRKYL